MQQHQQHIDRVDVSCDDIVEHWKTTTTRENCAKLAVALVAWFFMSLMLFGMNFMLDSFPDSRAASYSTLFSSALIFFGGAVVTVATMYILAHTTVYFSSAKPAFAGLLEWSHILQLAQLGFVDAMGGFAGTYGAPNTPIAVQFTIVATGVVWTFLFARWLVPDRDRPCTPFVFVAVSLTVVGAAVTIVPQWDSMEQLRGGVASSLGWIAVYLLASIFPLFLNVMYSRYLVNNVDHFGRSVLDEQQAAAGGSDEDEVNGGGGGGGGVDVVPVVGHDDNNNNNTNEQLEEVVKQERSKQQLQNAAVTSTMKQAAATAPPVASSPTTLAARSFGNWPFFCAKLSIALVGDGFFQLLFILLFLPLDFCPWFGAAKDAAQSGLWIQEGFADVFQSRTTPHTPIYFVLYFLGFFWSHIIGATLSYYSPQLTAFVYSVNTPMNLLLLVVFPSWNVFSTHAPAWASASSIVVTLVGAVMYALWEHTQRLRAALTAMRALPTS